MRESRLRHTPATLPNRTRRNEPTINVLDKKS
jgi:hypothetical protein